MTVWGNSYYYFETPDHADGAKKVWAVTKVVGSTCLMYGAWDLLMKKIDKKTGHLVNMEYCLGRMVRLTAAPVSTVIVGSTLAFMISNFRGKTDDCWNYFLGYLPTAAIWTAHQKNSGKGAFFGLTAAIVAASVKKGHIEDWRVVPEAPLPGTTRIFGPFGGDHMGDWRTERTMYNDPGRRPSRG